MRRKRAKKRNILPDPKFNNPILGRFVNCLMKDGKRSLAQDILYKSLDYVKEKTKVQNPLEIFSKAIKNISPNLELKARRVGGANYQVPIQVRGDRKIALAMRWIINAARSRKGKSMHENLALEVMDAANEQGAAFKKKQDTHRMAEANKAFAHFAY